MQTINLQVVEGNACSQACIWVCAHGQFFLRERKRTILGFSWVKLLCAAAFGANTNKKYIKAGPLRTKDTWQVGDVLGKVVTWWKKDNIHHK